MYTYLNITERAGVLVVNALDLWHWYDLGAYAIVAEKSSRITEGRAKSEYRSGCSNNHGWPATTAEWLIR